MHFKAGTSKIIPVLGFVAVLALAGCASDTGINETGYTEAPLYNRQGQKLSSADAQRLYESARDYLLHGKPEKALPLYAEVSARFPFTPYAAQSDLESIAAHYRDHDYEQTTDSADRFIKLYPRNPNVDYAYYMRGLANYARNNRGFLGAPPDRRNVSYLKQAFSDFSQLLRNFPDSDYAEDAQLHMLDIRNRLADFELRIAEYYYQRRAYVASSRRAADILTRYQGSDATPRALEIMEGSYEKLKLPDLAADTRAVLQDSYPDYLLHRKEFYQEKAASKPRGLLNFGNKSDAGNSGANEQD